jgi:chaperone modulatory protein CbpM
MTTLQELLRLHGRLTEVHIERWVARGLLRPTRAIDDWSFEQVDVARTGLLAELTADIGLDEDTAETVVDLLDQVHALRRQLRLLAESIAQQPPATREAIAVTLKKLGES